MSSPLKSKLDALVARAEQIVLAKQGGDHRVVEELHNLSGQFFAGTLLRSLLIALRDAVFVLVVLTVILIVNAALQCGSATSVQCVLEKTELLPTAIFLLLCGGSAAILSFLCCKKIMQRRFQHSSLMSAFVLIVVILTLLFFNASWLVTISAPVVLFFALYFGYKRAFITR